MRNRGLLNPFSKETKLLFLEKRGYVYCFLCGRTGQAKLHHIKKRISNSPFNGCPLCLICHKRGDLHHPKIRQKLLKKTIEYLKSINYKRTQKDILFLTKKL